MTRPLPVELVRRNMRRYGTGRTATYATRFKPFVISEHGITVHRTEAVMLQWGISGKVGALVWFKCRTANNTTSHPEFHDVADVPGARRCAKCFNGGAR